MADTPAREKTTYVVIREVKSAESGVRYDPVEAGIEANSAEHALRTWADKAKEGTTTGVYIAIPSRSFRPTKVAFEKTTVVKVGG